MPKPFTNSLRVKMRTGQPMFGMFVTFDDPTVTEVAADAGLDWICVDMEHGHLDFHNLLDHLRAAQGSDLAVLARVPTSGVDHVKRVLDLGSHGVVLPLIDTADQLAEGLAFARYPPRGVRGVSNMRAMRYGPLLQSYVETADDETLVIPIVETALASDNIDELLAVNGLEALLFGPADLSQSRGHRGAWEGPGVAADILRMAGKARERGIVTGIMGLSPDDIDRRLQQGFGMVGIGSDVFLLMKQISAFAERYGAGKLDLVFSRPAGEPQ